MPASKAGHECPIEMARLEAISDGAFVQLSTVARRRAPVDWATFAATETELHETTAGDRVRLQLRRRGSSQTPQPCLAQQKSHLTAHVGVDKCFNFKGDDEAAAHLRTAAL